MNNGSSPWRIVSPALALLFTVCSATAQVSDVVAPAAPEPRRTIRGVVFDDSNHNGHRDAGESGIGGVAVSDQRNVVVTGPDGRFELAPATDASLVFVSVPDGWSTRRFWQALDVSASGPAGVDFALDRRPASPAFTFIHASDTHLDGKSLPRIRLLRQLVERNHPDFVLLTGDLVRDALRVKEEVAQGYYDLVAAELARFPVPVFTVPGNHELFGIERHLSLVSKDDPVYGRGMYRRTFGPEYYSFDWGGVHFLGIDSVDFDDLWYYGHVDAVQMAWLEKDVALVRAETPVVTFNHIPFATAMESVSGYTEDPPAPSLIRIGGRMQYRHVVSNAADVLARIAPHRLEIALGGHMHARETLALETTLGRVRFHQAAAVVGPSEASGLHFVSGAILYRVNHGHVDDGTFLPLDAMASRP